MQENEFLKLTAGLSHRLFAWMILPVTYHRIVSDIIWRSLFRVISGSGVSAYSLWSNPGSLNEYTCDTHSEDYKSSLIGEWNGVKEVSALAHHTTVLYISIWTCTDISYHETKPYRHGTALIVRTLRQKSTHCCCISKPILISTFAKYGLPIITIIQWSNRPGIKHRARVCHSRDLC